MIKSSAAFSVFWFLPLIHLIWKYLQVIRLPRRHGFPLLTPGIHLVSWSMNILELSTGCLLNTTLSAFREAYRLRRRALTNFHIYVTYAVKEKARLESSRRGPGLICRVCKSLSENVQLERRPGAWGWPCWRRSAVPTRRGGGRGPGLDVRVIKGPALCVTLLSKNLRSTLCRRRHLGL